MAKFYVYATEKVFYLKIIEADNIESAREIVSDDDFKFSNSDIVDGTDLEIHDIEEVPEQ